MIVFNFFGIIWRRIHGLKMFWDTNGHGEKFVAMKYAGRNVPERKYTSKKNAGKKVVGDEMCEMKRPDVCIANR